MGLSSLDDCVHYTLAFRQVRTRLGQINPSALLVDRGRGLWAWLWHNRTTVISHIPSHSYYTRWRRWGGNKGAV